MKIAQVSPLYESVPPKLYGGTERVVSWLTEELVRLGHEVTLFASGDSETKANLIPVCRESLRLKEGVIDGFAYHFVELQMVQDHLKDFDIIHYHTDYFHFPISIKTNVAHLTTLHGRLDLPDLQDVYNIFSKMPVVSISNSQRQALPQANFIDTVYHGLPENLLSFGDGSGGYLAFLGRICPEKGLPQSIEVAKRTGIPLKIAAKVDKADVEYYEREIKHLLDHPLIEYIGEINEQQKQEFLGNALATLFLIDWPEPFGLVMIESMACGTPVIARPLGSVPEIMADGVSGYIVNNVEEAVRAVKQIQKLDRTACRQYFDSRFKVDQMAKNYVRLYEQMVQKEKNGRIYPLLPSRPTSNKKLLSG